MIFRSRYWKLCVVLMLLAGAAVLFAACGEDEATTTTAATAPGGSTDTTSGPTDTTATETTETPTDTTLGGKDTVVWGAARSISGGQSIFEETAMGPIYKMYVDDINAAGGLEVAEYGKKMPIELKIYDDQSSIDTCTRLYEKLIVEDKVDFLFGPTSTAFLYAAAEVAKSHHYIMMAAEGGATSLHEQVKENPYIFGDLQFADWNQVPVLVSLMQEVGVKSVGIFYIDDLHGMEYSSVAEEELAGTDIELMFKTAIPGDIKDWTNQIKQAESANPDAICLFAYPDQNFPAIGAMIQLDYNPKMILTGPGACYQAFADSFGPAADGVMGFGAWNAKSSPGLAEFTERFEARYTKAAMDWWGGAPYYSTLQALGQAIEKAGSLDQEKVLHTLNTEHFQTISGDWYYDTQLPAVECYPGMVGQWQDGVFEVVDPGAKRTAEPIFPKMEWPK